MRFKPISFKRDCLACHASELEVGPADARISVPHGDEQNVYNALRLYAPKGFSRYSETLKTEGCAYCHDIIESSKKDSLSWRIAPLFINPDWFSKAEFNHAMHRTQQCTSCHKIEDSESSAEIAMPNRESCLQCHSGNRPKHKRIASGCMSCHNFHHTHAGESVLLGNIINKKDIDVLMSNTDHSK
jgi:predicted CXXCH cytochrome family protein